MIGTWKLNICSLTDASFFKSVSPDSGHVHRSQNFLYVLDTFGLNRVMGAREGNCSTKFLEHKVWQINLNLSNVHYIICVLSVWTDAVFIQFLSQWESPCPFDLKKKRRYCSILDLAHWLFCWSQNKSGFHFILLSLCNSPHKQISSGQRYESDLRSQVTSRGNTSGLKKAQFNSFHPINGDTLMCLLR